MCGIFGCFGYLPYTRSDFLEISKKLRHRGPDWNGIYIDNHCAICHERLSIVGVGDGSQPIVSDDGNIILSVNGEIYNYKDLYDVVLQNRYTPQTKSDCEVIIYLYKELGTKFINMLDGIFSFILYDKLNKKILCARDPIGIIPLYIGINNVTGEELNGNLAFSSEIKCLEYCSEVSNFEPGTFIECDMSHILTSYNIQLTNTKYYKPLWKDFDIIKSPTHGISDRRRPTNYNKYLEIDSNEETDQLKLIETGLINSVKKRLMADVPFGVLLSGGLDSSLIASITSRLIKEDNKNTFCNNLHSFSIGLNNSPDLLAARKVADFLGTIHHELNFTVQDGIDSIRDLIYYLETFDVTTIRASTPMFLMSRKIKSHGIKMVLSGEGADEIFGGYLYFHQAPNDNEFHEECKKRVNDLYKFDCLRANKSTMAWGLEARVPFLDKRFLELCIPIHPKNKCHKKIEKYALRKAFDSTENPYLPKEILWRQKEQFTDGVGYKWLDTLVEHCEKSITDEDYNLNKSLYKNKEEMYYKQIFDELFPNREQVVDRWIPKTEWNGVSYDPSGRAQSSHIANKSNITNSKL